MGHILLLLSVFVFLFCSSVQSRNIELVKNNCACKCDPYVWHYKGEPIGNCLSADESGRRFCYISGISIKLCSDAKIAEALSPGLNVKRKYLSFAACESTMSNCSHQEPFDQHEEMNTLSGNVPSYKTGAENHSKFPGKVGAARVTDGIARNYETGQLGIESRSHGLSGLSEGQVPESSQVNKTWFGPPFLPVHVGVSKIRDDIEEFALVNQSENTPPEDASTNEVSTDIKVKLTTNSSISDDVTDDFPRINSDILKTGQENQNFNLSRIGVDKLVHDIINDTTKYQMEGNKLQQNDHSVAGISNDLINSVKVNETLSSAETVIGSAKVYNSILTHIQGDVVISHHGTSVTSVGVAGISDVPFRLPNQNQNKTTNNQSQDATNLGAADNVADTAAYIQNNSSHSDLGVARVADDIIKFTDQQTEGTSAKPVVTRIQGDPIRNATNHQNASSATNPTDQSGTVNVEKLSQNNSIVLKEVAKNMIVSQKNQKVRPERIDDALETIANQQNKTIPSPPNEAVNRNGVSNNTYNFVQNIDKLPSANKSNYGIIYQMLSAIKGYHIVKPPKLMEIEKDGDKIRVRVNRIKGSRTVFAETDIPQDFIL